MPASLILLSNDGKLFPISNEAAQTSEVLKTIMEEEFYKYLDGKEKMMNFIVPLEDIDGSTLARIVEFMNHHVIEPMNHMELITATTSSSSNEADSGSASSSDSEEESDEIYVTTVTTTPNVDDDDDDDTTEDNLATISMPGANQSFYGSFLPRPTSKGEISKILRGAHELMITPLLQYMYFECTMYMLCVWERIPTFAEIYAAFFLGIDDSYINMPLDAITCKTKPGRLSCSRRLARLQSQSHSLHRIV